MKIILTGANGYIGKRLLPALLQSGHEVICCVRDKNRFTIKERNQSRVSVVEIDFLSANRRANCFLQTSMPPII